METHEVRECMKKLATYEETGLSPEEVKQYKIFEDSLVLKYRCTLEQTLDLLGLHIQDRIIVLPCAIGEDLYITSNRVDGKGHVRRVMLTHNNLGNILKRIGDDVFLTREEAEKALGKLNEK